jgi:hypothetical protein
MLKFLLPLLLLTQVSFGASQTVDLSGGSSGGATTNLSNLLAPTAISADLIFNTGAAATLKTKDDSAASNDLTITTGNSSADQTGSISIYPGISAVGASQGALNIFTPDLNGDAGLAPSGNIETYTGGSAAGSGNYRLYTSNVASAAASGSVFISAGSSATGNSGDIKLTIGTAGATRGGIYLINGTEGTTAHVLKSSGTGGKAVWGPILNANVDASAGIVDTKLATISTAGKVSNSATTATSANTNSAIVARDGSGNFSAGTITAALTGAVTGTASGNTTYSANNHGVVLSSATNAMTVLAPDASTTKFLQSGGASANPAWAALPALLGARVNISGWTPADYTTAMPFTSSDKSNSNFSSSLIGTNQFVAVHTGIHMFGASAQSSAFSGTITCGSGYSVNNAAFTTQMVTTSVPTGNRCVFQWMDLAYLTAGDVVRFFASLTSGTETMSAWIQEIYIP